jgi:hypothetical protein
MRIRKLPVPTNCLAKILKFAPGCHTSFSRSLPDSCVSLPASTVPNHCNGTSKLKMHARISTSLSSLSCLSKPRQDRLVVSILPSTNCLNSMTMQTALELSREKPWGHARKRFAVIRTDRTKICALESSRWHQWTVGPPAWYACSSACNVGLEICRAPLHNRSQHSG